VESEVRQLVVDAEERAEGVVFHVIVRSYIYTNWTGLVSQTNSCFIGWYVA
jgi:hypothetical protein